MAIADPKALAADSKGIERRLTIIEIVDWLVQDGMVDPVEAEKMKKERRYYRGSQHPLAVVADQKWKSLKPPSKVLTLEVLTEWVAKHVGLEYRHIDPLKIDFTAVTEVMSSAYATRFKILPIGVTTKEAVIAVCEPYVREWEKELQRITKLELRRVICNPQDIERYQVEFYNLAKSVKGATKGTAGVSGLSNFEQLVELGSGNKQFDANDAHIVKVVDWLWSYAFEQRASDIHIEPRREFGIVRFRIDGVLHQVYQVPVSVLAAMTSRIKILSRMDVVEKRRPQDGRIKTRTLAGEEVELRLST
ncbi:MAG: ATPase, T2SS/T4P/T4SS family, partial [Chthoniobacteraceae bacterium]